MADNKIKNRRKLLKEVCNYPEFKEGIKKSNYENLSLTRKITLFTLKNKLYFFTSIICKIRQKQNQSKGKRWYMIYFIMIILIIAIISTIIIEKKNNKSNCYFFFDMAS